MNPDHCQWRPVEMLKGTGIEVMRPEWPYYRNFAVAHQGNRISSPFVSNVCHPDHERGEGEGSAVVFSAMR
jgi:hypothetical protein